MGFYKNICNNIHTFDVLTPHENPIDIPIGDIIIIKETFGFHINNELLEVCDADKHNRYGEICAGCIFNLPGCQDMFACTPSKRKDHKDVFFKKL